MEEGVNFMWIGMDCGASNVKIAYEEGNQLRLKSYPAEKSHSLLQWLHSAYPQSRIALTGGGAHSLFDKLPPAQIRIFSEFDAIEAGFRAQNREEAALLLHSGTGSSFFVFREKEKGERVLGSAMGGGMILGLARFLYGNSFDEKDLYTKIQDGDRLQVDLLVKDIYTESSPVMGDLTASQFAKASESSRPSDMLASTVQSVAEVFVLLSQQLAEKIPTKRVYLSGGAFSYIAPLVERIKSFEEMTGLSFQQVEQGMFLGAKGARELALAEMRRK